MPNYTPASQLETQTFAQTIAAVLHDSESLGKYIVCCRKYPAPIIQKALRTAQAIPEAKVKKSRAALFFYFVKKYAHQSD